MVSVAAKGNTLWVCDPSLVSYALEQPEMLRSPDYSCKCCAQFKFAPTVSTNTVPSIVDLTLKPFTFFFPKSQKFPI